MSRSPLPLFSAFGIELEYMLVDAQTLDIRPIADQVMQLEAGKLVSDVEFEDISWSNELVLHVLELKTTDPAPSLVPIAEQMQTQVRRVNELAGQLGAVDAHGDASVDGPLKGDAAVATRLQSGLRVL